MLKAASAAGYLNEKDAVLESLIAIKRAGVDLTSPFCRRRRKVVAGGVIV